MPAVHVCIVQTGLCHALVDATSVFAASVCSASQEAYVLHEPSTCIRSCTNLCLRAVYFQVPLGAIEILLPSLHTNRHVEQILQVFIKNIEQLQPERV